MERKGRWNQSVFTSPGRGPEGSSHSWLLVGVSFSLPCHHIKPPSVLPANRPHQSRWVEPHAFVSSAERLPVSQQRSCCAESSSGGPNSKNADPDQIRKSATRIDPYTTKCGSSLNDRTLKHKINLNLSKTTGQLKIDTWNQLYSTQVASPRAPHLLTLKNLHQLLRHFGRSAMQRLIPRELETIFIGDLSTVGIIARPNTLKHTGRSAVSVRFSCYLEHDTGNCKNNTVSF